MEEENSGYSTPQHTRKWDKKIYKGWWRVGKQQEAKNKQTNWVNIVFINRGKRKINKAM